MGFPRFVEVSDRQLQEAISLIQKEFSKGLDGDIELSPAAIEALIRFRNGSVFDYLRWRLPEVLGFVPRKR